MRSFISSFPAATFAALLLACGVAQAEEIAGRRFDFPIPERLSRSGGELQMRAGVGYATGAEEELGVLLQPRLEARSDSYGRLFGTATTTGGFRHSPARPSGADLGKPADASIKQAYAGWSSGSLLSAFEEDALTLSFGREGVDDGSGTIHWSAQGDSCDAGCWLSRRPTRFQSLSAKLRVREFQGQVFHLRSLDVAEFPDFAGTSAVIEASALRLGAGWASPVREDRFELDPARGYGRLEASYEFTELLPWSTALSAGYGFVSGGPADQEADTDQSIPVALMYAGAPMAYVGGNRVAEIGIAIEPADGLDDSGRGLRHAARR